MTLSLVTIDWGDIYVYVILLCVLPVVGICLGIRSFFRASAQQRNEHVCSLCLGVAIAVAMQWSVVCGDHDPSEPYIALAFLLAGFWWHRKTRRAPSITLGRYKKTWIGFLVLLPVMVASIQFLNRPDPGELTRRRATILAFNVILHRDLVKDIPPDDRRLSSILTREFPDLLRFCPVGKDGFFVAPVGKSFRVFITQSNVIVRTANGEVEVTERIPEPKSVKPKQGQNKSL